MTNSMTASKKKRETHPNTNTNIKPLSNQQRLYCVVVMEAQCVWTLAMCSVQHKRDNLRSWPSGKQTVWLLLWSQSLCCCYYHKRHRPPVSWAPYHQVSEQINRILASALNQLLDRQPEGEQDGERVHSGEGCGHFNMCTSNWAD